MNSIKQWWVGAAGAAALVAVIGAGAVMAQTPSTTTPSTPTATQSAPTTTVPGTTAQGTATAATPGTFKSHEDPTHEAAETAQQEADEDAGRGRHGSGKPNEDAAHEANETAAQEADEDAGQSPSATPGG